MKTGAAGYTEWLLFHLWKPDDNTGMCCPYINLTDTIIYRWAKPFFWYYTLPDGEIVRRSKTKVNHKFIYEEFIKTEHKVIATYMSFGDST